MTRRDQDALGPDGPEDLAALDALDVAWDRLMMTGADIDIRLDQEAEAIVRTIHARQPVPVGIARRVWGRANASHSGAAPATAVRAVRLGSGVGRAPGLVAGRAMPGFELVAAALILMVIGGLVSGGGRMPGMGRFGPETASAEAIMLPASAGPVATPDTSVDGLIVAFDPGQAASSDHLAALDPVTLLPVLGDPGPGRPNFSGSVIFSADGSTRVDILPPPTLPTGDIADRPTEISVRDAVTGNERRRITFPVALAGGLLSADGTRLIGVATGTADLPQTWFVIPLTASAPDGLIHVEADTVPEPPHGLDDRFVVDADARYLYRLVTLGSRLDPGPRPTQLAVSDLETGGEIARIDLPGVVAGPHLDGTGPDPTEFDPQPALALSPDGTRLAIVHFDRAAVTTIAIATNGEPTSTGTVELLPAQGVSGVYTGERARLSATFGSDNATLYVFGELLIPATWGAREVPIGIRRIDLERGEIVAEGVSDQRILQASVTDGDVYVTVTPVDGMPPTAPPLEAEAQTLMKLDARTLDIEEERTFAVADVRIAFLRGAME